MGFAITRCFIDGFQCRYVLPDQPFMVPDFWRFGILQKRKISGDDICRELSNAKDWRGYCRKRSRVSKIILSFYTTIKYYLESCEEKGTFIRFSFHLALFGFYRMFGFLGSQTSSANKLWSQSLNVRLRIADPNPQLSSKAAAPTWVQQNHYHEMCFGVTGCVWIHVDFGTRGAFEFDRAIWAPLRLWDWTHRLN